MAESREECRETFALLGKPAVARKAAIQCKLVFSGSVLMDSSSGREVMAGMDPAMRPARQRRYLMWGAVWFTAVTGLVWLLLIGFAILRLARGNVDGPRSWDEAVFGPSLAAMVCLIPGWLVFLLAGRYVVSPSGENSSAGGANRDAMLGASSAGVEAPSRPNPLILILAGWGIRFAGVGIAVGVAMNTPLAKDMGFWLSLVVLYGVTLAMETAIVRRVPDIV